VKAAKEKGIAFMDASGERHHNTKQQRMFVAAVGLLLQSCRSSRLRSA
jgi:hypothetical protein